MKCCPAIQAFSSFVDLWQQEKLLTFDFVEFEAFANFVSFVDLWQLKKHFKFDFEAFVSFFFLNGKFSHLIFTNQKLCKFT